MRCDVFGIVLIASLLPGMVGAEEGPNTKPLRWNTDYHAGLDAAEQSHKLALIWFYDAAASDRNSRFEKDVLHDPRVVSSLDVSFAPTKLATSVVVESGGASITLLDHPSFAEIQHQPGLAIVDMTEPDGPLHRQVVSVYPFTRGEITADKLAVLLDLPRGTLTQRTLIYAVRTHPEAPASTMGHLSPILSRETENHAWHQASITLQGHHNWNERFHAINAQLPGGMAAREVCAESWPGQNLIDAAVECVHSWRQSSGHWEAVRSQHALFGYDMKRGRNGVWYAAGIFAGRN